MTHQANIGYPMQILLRRPYLYQILFCESEDCKQNKYVSKSIVITAPNLFEFIENNDIDGLNDYLADDEYLMFDEPMEFATEQEALTFCTGLGHG